MTAERVQMQVQSRRRRWRLVWMALAATLIALWSWRTPAAEPPPCPAQPGTLGAALCERARLMDELCGPVEADMRGHCQACLLENNPLPCEDLTAAEAPRCRVVLAAIDRCVLAGPTRIDACLRRSTASRVLLTTFITQGNTP
ncbi:hypothetical protein [Sphaerotilus sp.]|uniref:hypothetical protein n=1 Tax=Sphaerotilus sp. TaxID=2093942 RepID=UPI002ACE51B8|nr:hypothetical protein [Sphaerotilus sp.]MDZ7855815.1 hypothetical protein [Sphaerotilus sp.]